MSVQSSTSRIQYVGNVSTVTPYVVPFYFFANSHLVVVVTDEDGADITLTLTTDYSVTGAGVISGGSIVTVAAIPATSTVTIYRSVPLTQETVYSENADFPAQTQEAALDKLTMIVQQLSRAVTGSYRVRESDGVMNEVQAVANTILGLDSLKQPRTFTASELASFLNLTAQYFDRPIKTFADAGERAAAIPEFEGQLGTQRDTGMIYISDGVTAGDWVIFLGSGVITNAMLAAGILSADANGLAKMADGYLAASTAGRAKMADGFLTLAKLAAETTAFLVPTGSVIWVPANAAPTGFLKLNGASLSRATYSALWAFANASGNTVVEASWSANTGKFSTGDLSTTFRVPDLRGYFVRGWDDSRGVDSGRAIGTYQADALKTHTHANNVGALSGYSTSSDIGAGFGFNNSTATQTGNPSTGTSAETRPMNAALLACIKY